MNEPVQTAYLQGRSRALGPFRDSGEGTEKKWFTTICPSFGKSNSLSRRRHPEVHIGSTCGCVTVLALEDDGGGSIVRGDGAVGCDGTPSVRGPPSPGLRARIWMLLRKLMVMCGVSLHTYSIDCFGRITRKFL